MSEAIAFSASVWHAQRGAPDRAAVIDHLRSVRDTADRLLRLLFPASGQSMTPFYKGKRREEADYAMSRLGRRLPLDVSNELRSTLTYLQVKVDAEIEEISKLDTLQKGGDSTHTDDLLKELLPILRRNGLSDSYTTPMGESQNRRAAAVDLAMLLMALWPREIPHPTEGAVMDRLVKIRSEARSME